MTIIVRVQYTLSTGNTTYNNKVEHFEGRALHTHCAVSAREVATEFIHGLWLDKLIAERNKNRYDYTVHQVLEIDVEAGTSQPLWWEEPAPMMLRDFGTSEVHIIVTSDGSYDWTTDPDSFVEFEKEVLDDERPRGPVVWHALVEVPGHEADDCTELASEIAHEFVHGPLRRGEHVDLLGPWRDAVD